MNSLVSIIVPLYNKVGQIRRCIDSVLAQTYDNWELILIDDGSTDKSSIVAKSYLSDSRISYYYKKNGGVSSARNMGIKKAQGDWVIFLDADDYFLPEALSVLLNTALSFNTLVSSANFYVEKEGKRYGFCEGKTRIVKNNFRAFYLCSCVIRAGNTIFNSSITKSYLFDESLCRYEDYKYWLNIMRYHKIAYASENVMIYSEENLELSKRIIDIKKDYIFSLDFAGKSFWEKILLVTLINQGLVLYPEYKKLLKAMYKKELWLKYIEKALSLSVFFYLRFIRAKRKIYRYTVSRICHETKYHYNKL